MSDRVYPQAAKTLPHDGTVLADRSFRGRPAAPTVIEAMLGGKVRITLAASRPRRQRDNAHTLVGAFNSGVLPVAFTRQSMTGRAR
jgi:hypothetical protein